MKIKAIHTAWDNKPCIIKPRFFPKETAESTMGVTVKNMADTYPADWQLIEEKQEKRPIMSYIILSVMMLLYLYAGLAETNWPLIPATILGFYLLIKIERDGRK